MINVGGFLASLLLVVAIGLVLDWRTPGPSTAYTPEAFRWAMSTQYVLWAVGLTQQHGFLHAGMVATALDSACGYAGFTLMAADAAVLTIEFKINLLAPAKGERFRMEGRVLKPGRTITVCEGRAFAIDGSQEKLIATMGCTLMAVTGRDNIQG